MPTPRPTIVVMFSTKMDIGMRPASIDSMPMEMKMAKNPTATGMKAATRAPKAKMSRSHVSGSRRRSIRSESSAATVRVS
jgi:hypothetical protein